MALRLSCLIHCALLLLFTGCALHLPIIVLPSSDTGMKEDREFVGAIAEKMPLWDADVLATYERAEIAIVKADIAMAQQSEDEAVFIEYVQKLHADWDALIALDELLRKESVI
jgi:hypothetical protein